MVYSCSGWGCWRWWKLLFVISFGVCPTLRIEYTTYLISTYVWIDPKLKEQQTLYPTFTAFLWIAHFLVTKLTYFSHSTLFLLSFIFQNRNIPKAYTQNFHLIHRCCNWTYRFRVKRHASDTGNYLHRHCSDILARKWSWYAKIWFRGSIKTHTHTHTTTNSKEFEHKKTRRRKVKRNEKRISSAILVVYLLQWWLNGRWWL